MSGRGRYLFTRLQIMALGAFVCAVIFLTALCVVAYRAGGSGLLFLMPAALTGLGAGAYHWLVGKPYRQTNKALGLFLGGYSLDSAQRVQYPMSPMTAASMDKLIEQLRRQALEGTTKKQAEYLALQNQINPHFLYNTLESIRSEALLMGMEELADMTESLATFFRYCISNVDALVTLDDELSNISNYFQIQRFRFGERLNLEILTDRADEDRISRCRLPKMTLQPIVENAVFHGIEPMTGRGLLRIGVELTARCLIVTVSDNGVGMSAEMTAEINHRLSMATCGDEQGKQGRRTSIALSNVSRRIKLLFGENYGLSVYSLLGGGTDVVITLPNQEEERV